MTRLIKHLRPFAPGIACVVFLVLLQTLADLLLPALMAEIVDAGIAANDVGLIFRKGSLMLLAALLGSAGLIAAELLSARISAGFGSSLRRKVFCHVQGFSVREFDRFGVSTLITRTTNDILQVQMVILLFLRMVVAAPMMFVGGIAMAVSRDIRLSLILAAALPAVLGTVAVVAAKGLPLFRAMQEKLDRLNAVLREGLTGIRVIRAFNRVEHEAKCFEDANRDIAETAMKAARLMAIPMPAITATLNFTAMAIVWAGSWRVEAGSLQVGGLMAFIQYAMQMLWSLIMVSMMFVMFPRASASARRINEVLDAIPSIEDPKEAKAPAPGRGAVEFRSVSFSYPGAQRPAISNASFKANPGEVTAIVGGTGSGKSTLAHLLLRFHDADQGAILIDGVDVREMTQEDLRRKIGFVPQKPVLFTGTIGYNIRYGDLEATDEDIQNAAETAQALDFIRNSKEGFDSPISRGGTNISGGQKQRLSIARALVRKPRIYLFDDALSAIDFRTDLRLRKALRKVTRDATVIIVAQRVNTVMDADRIVVLDHGSVAGIGTHRELLETCQVYQEIVASQLAKEEIA